MKRLTKQKRPFALLEVIIAFTLVALCALPLIYPHVAILRAEKAFVADVELDHVVSLLYGNVLQKLYLKEIPWSDIIEGKPQGVDEQMLEQIGIKHPLPFVGTYTFKEVKSKPPKPEKRSVHLFCLTFEFSPIKGKIPDGREKPLRYEYKVMIDKVQP